MKRLILTCISCFILFEISCQQKDTVVYSVGTYNAPQISILKYELIEYSLQKTLSEEEFLKIGTGYLFIDFKINNKGNVYNANISHMIGLYLNDLDSTIFILNLKKYIKFNVPELYTKTDTLTVNIVYRKR